ncbi:30S ribosomal protein S8 [Candidatus Peregrinibacteria bacterium CG10_big_fil_rev_8_21_14_0_10_55_24]|nr:MAG: 30S ribosomal protein S8 [Candidatus Peregrinibacteria bacterium CG10_big_fil_rev_8_21_14_0_10_55_24]
MAFVTDPIGDLLTRMRNAQSAGQTECRAPWSRTKQSLCEILQKEGWIAGVKVEGEALRQNIVVTFSPEKNRLILKRVSKPGRRVYKGVAELKPFLRGYGIAIITTSQGLLTDAQARKKGVGGELLCTIA